MLSLPPGEVHVWRVRVDVAARDHARLEQTLSGEERGRASRLRRREDRIRFVVARAALREVLGRYLGAQPSKLRIQQELHGKPALASTARLDFNVSHSGDVALLAVTGRGSVGVDVEQIDGRVDCEELAARFFSRREVAALRVLPPAARQRAFFTCWTRKEAYLKARGIGLAAPLDRFDVSLAPDEPARLVATRGELVTDASWWIEDCAVAPGYVASIAGSGPPAGLVYREWA